MNWLIYGFIDVDISVNDKSSVLLRVSNWSSNAPVQDSVGCVRPIIFIY